MSQTTEPQTTEPEAQVRIPVRDQARPASNRTGTTDLGDRLGDTRLGALSAAVAKLVGDYGRRPSSATVGYSASAAWSIAECAAGRAAARSMGVSERGIRRALSSKKISRQMPDAQMRSRTS